VKITAAAVAVREQGLHLGEGQTPLLQAKVLGREVWFKCEYLNPTGSFKDRGSATLAAFLQRRGVTAAVEDSSGNAVLRSQPTRRGPAWHRGLFRRCVGPKRQQIQLYGARLTGGGAAIQCSGRRSDRAAEAAGSTRVMRLRHLTSRLRHLRGAGGTTGQAPAAIILPDGQGGLLLGMARVRAGEGRQNHRGCPPCSECKRRPVHHWWHCLRWECRA
jgi:threonine synthase